MNKAPLLSILMLLLTACGITPGPAYDSTQDNPANYLPEQIILVADDDTKPAIINPIPVTGESGHEAEYQAWLDARDANSDEYKNFLEFRDWLKYKNRDHENSN